MTFLHHIFNSFESVPFALYITAAVYALLGIIDLRPQTRGGTATYLAWLMLAMAWWSAGYGMEIHIPGLAAKLFWVDIEYPAIAAIPLLWLFFVLDYIGQPTLLTRRTRILLAVIPLLTVLAVWTNGLHHLVYSETHTEVTNGLDLLVVTHGPYFWIHIIYSNLLLGSGSILLFSYVFRSFSLYRTQAILILLALLPPWIGSAIYIANLVPVHGLDMTPFAFIPPGIMLTWMMARYHLLDILPPAQTVILQNLRDGVVLLNASRQVLYMNRAAEQILSQNADQALGQRADLVCRECGVQIMPLLTNAENMIEVTMGEHEPRQYEVRVSPAYFTKYEYRLGQPSHIVLFHDITERKKAGMELERREAILHAISRASSLFLKSASWEKHIPAVLEQMGRAADVSRVYLFEQFPSDDELIVAQRHEWTAEGIPSHAQDPVAQNDPWQNGALNQWLEILRRGDPVAGSIGEFSAAEQEILAAQGIRSIAVMPVIVDDEFWGFIGVDDCVRERQWGEAELGALHVAGDIFGAALKRGRVEKKLLRRQHSLDLLQAIIRATLVQTDLEQMSQFLVDHLGILIQADDCFVTLWDEVTQQTTFVAAYGKFRGTYKNLKVLPGEKTFTTSALELKHALIVDDAKDTPYSSPRLAAQIHMATVLVIPMLVEGKKLGAVLLGFQQPHHFTQEEIEISEQAADLIAIAIAKFRAMEEAQRRAEESETLRRAGVAITETLNLQEATTRLLEQLAFVLPHDSASVQLLREGALEIINSEGLPNPSAVIGMRFPVTADNPNAIVYQTRQPYLLNEADKVHAEFNKPPHNHIRSWLGVPLIVRNEFIGLLAIDSHEPFHFTPDNIELVNVFAGQVAVAIENARLFDEVQRLAITDGLTGLHNRRHFLELAQTEFERARRYKRNLSAMIFDIDYFKQINDTYGHPIGDQVLCAIATICTDKLREADPIGRYGGEEFIALIVETPSSVALKVGERLRQEVENLTVHTEKGDLKVTVSIGIADLNEMTPNLETLINRADQAMYVAKHKGRNRVMMSR